MRLNAPTSALLAFLSLLACLAFGTRCAACGKRRRRTKMNWTRRVGRMAEVCLSCDKADRDERMGNDN